MLDPNPYKLKVPAADCPFPQFKQQLPAVVWESVAESELLMTGPGPPDGGP